MLVDADVPPRADFHADLFQPHQDREHRGAPAFKPGEQKFEAHPDREHREAPKIRSPADAAKFAVRRQEDEPTRSRLLYEIFYGYFLPQFEGIDDESAIELYQTVSELFEPAEQTEARRTIGEVFGTPLAV